MTELWWRRKPIDETDRIAIGLADRLHLTVLGSAMTETQYHQVAEVVHGVTRSEDSTVRGTGLPVKAWSSGATAFGSQVSPPAETFESKVLGLLEQILAVLRDQHSNDEQLVTRCIVCGQFWRRGDGHSCAGSEMM